MSKLEFHMMRWGLVFLISLLTTVGRAEEIWVHKESSGLERFLILRAENKAWFVESYEKAVGRWQNRREQHIFPSEIKARQELSERLKRTSYEQRSSQEIYGREPTAIRLQRQGQPVIWETQNQWNEDWEAEYARWVAANVKKDFLKIHGVASDCADLAFSVRWIFARIHHLPAANRLAGTGELFSNSSMRPEWLNLPTSNDWTEDRRFFAALNYLLDNTYTQTLFPDSYPIAIRPGVLTEGAHHLHLFGTGGHTMFVYKVNDPHDAPVKVLYSDVPRMVRDLYEGLYFQAEQVHPEISGFLKIRWPVEENGTLTLKPVGEMPEFSEEQYRPDFLADPKEPFYLAVYRRINPNFDPQQVASGMLDDIRLAFQNRVDIVKDGFAACQKIDCSPGTPGDENWSTPARDKRLLEYISQLSSFLGGFQTAELSALIRQRLTQPTAEIEGITYKLGDLLFGWLAGTYNSNPLQPIAARWGLSPSAYLDVMVSRLATLLGERRAKINASSDQCIQEQCEPRSPLWLQTESFALDQKIKDLNFWLTNYCHFLDSVSCDEMAGLIHGRLVLGRPLDDWLKEIPTFNSDPRNEIKVRWGELPNLNSFEIPGGASAALSEDRRWLLVQPADGENRFIQDLRLGQPLPLGPGEVPGQLHEKTSWVFSFHEGPSDIVVRFFNPSTAEKWTSLAFNKENPTVLFWAPTSEPRLVVGQSSRWMVYDPRTQVRQDYERWPTMTSEVGDALLAAKNGQLIILDFKEGEKVLSTTLLVSNVDVIKLMMSRPDFFVVEVNKAIFLVDRLTGVSQKVVADIGNNIIHHVFSDRRGALVSQGGAGMETRLWLGLLNPDLELHYEKEIGVVWGSPKVFPDESFSIADLGSGAFKIYRAGQVMPFPVLADETKVVWRQGDFLGTSASDLFRVRSLKGDQIYYESTRYFEAITSDLQNIWFLNIVGFERGALDIETCFLDTRSKTLSPFLFTTSLIPTTFFFGPVALSETERQIVVPAQSSDAILKTFANDTALEYEGLLGLYKRPNHANIIFWH